MKRKLSHMLWRTFALCAAVAASATVFSACNEEDPPFLDISSSEIVIEADASRETVDIRSNTSWTIDCPDEWCGLNITGNRHQGKLEISVGQNISTQERSTIISVNHVSGIATILVRQKGAEAQMDVSETYLTFYRNSDENNIVLACNNDWSAVSSKEWCTVSPASGNGDATIKIGVSDNLTNNPREATVTLKTKKNDGTTMMQTINVEQKATKASINITPKEKALCAPTETFIISILSNIDWVVKKDSDWITVDKTSGNGDDEIVVTVADNLTGKQRTGTVSVLTGSAYEDREVHTVHITQSSDDYFLEVPVTEYYLTEAASLLNIDYQMGGVNCQANAQTSADWLTLNEIKEGVVIYDVTSNESSQPRQAEITIYTSGQAGTPIIKKVTVIQSATGHLLDIFFEDYILDPDGETREVEVIASFADLELHSNATWFEVNYDPGTKKIKLKADINLSGADRTAKVLVSMVIPSTGERISKEFSVTQAVSNYKFELNPEVLEISGDGETKIAQLKASGNWKIINYADLPNWLKVTPESGTGNAAIVASVKTSLSTISRSCTITLKDEKTEREIPLVVVQTPQIYTVNKYVGRGYDATGYYANDHSVRAQILDWDELVAADLVADMVTLNDMTEINYSATNSVSYQEKLTNTIKFGGSLKLFSMQITSNTSSSFYESQETEMGMYKHMTRDKALYIYDFLTASELKGFLTKTAIEDFENMDATTLVQKYGTHVLTGAVTGGSLEYTMAAERSSVSKASSWDTGIQAGFNKEKEGKLEAEVKNSHYDSISQRSIQFSEKLVVRGGDPQFASGFKSNNTYDQWLASMTDKSKLVLIEFYGSQMLPIWEFASGTTRQAEIKKAAEDYIKSKEIIAQRTHKTLTYTIDRYRRNAGTGGAKQHFTFNFLARVPGEMLSASTENWTMEGGVDREHYLKNPGLATYSLNMHKSHTLTVNLKGTMDMVASSTMRYDLTPTYTYDPADGFWRDSNNNEIKNGDVFEIRFLNESSYDRQHFYRVTFKWE